MIVWNLSVLTLFFLILDVRARVYYDADTCTPHKTLVDKAFKSAFEMVDRARDAIGSPHSPYSDAEQWDFPDQEITNLAARIFGDGGPLQKDDTSKGLPATLFGRMNIIKNNYDYMAENFKTDNIPLQQDVSSLTPSDILVYCTLDHLNPYVQGYKNDKEGREIEGGVDEKTYDGCAKGTLLGFTKHTTYNYQTLYLCHLNDKKKKIRKTIREMERKWLDQRKLLSDVCTIFGKTGKWEIDYYDLLDSTILHEMTHVIPSATETDPGPEKGEKYWRLTTDDVGKDKGYKWEGVYPLGKERRGYRNADSYAFFGLGTWLLKERQTTVNNEGCVQPLDNYEMGASGQITVGNAWQRPKTKRYMDPFVDLDMKRPFVNVLEVRQFVTSFRSSSFPSLAAPGVPISSGFSWSGGNGTATGPGTASRRSSILLSTGTGFEQTSASGLSSIRNSSDVSTQTLSSENTFSETRPFGVPPAGVSTIIDANHTTSGSVGQTTRANETLQTRTGTPTPSNSIPTISDIPPSSVVSNSTSGVSHITASTAAINGSSTMWDVTSTRASYDDSSATLVTSSTLVISNSSSEASKITSSPFASESSSAITEMSSPTATTNYSEITLGSSSKAWSEAPSAVSSDSTTYTTGPTTGPITSDIPTALPSGFFSQTPTTTPEAGLLLCVDMKSCPTPTWLEGIVYETDLFIPEVTDLSAVPTKKVKKNDDDDDNNAVIFVKIELPDDKCNPLPKPKAGGLLGIVANVANKVVDTVMDAACNMEFPVIKGNMPDWMDLTKFPGLKGYTEPTKDPDDPNEDPDESSSSAQESASSTSSESCSATPIPSCKETALISGTVTKSFTTECTTITACSGSAITSLTQITASPTATGEIFVHPEGSEEFQEEQECYQGIMEKTDISMEDIEKCLGITPTSWSASTSEYPSSTGASSSSASTGSQTPTTNTNTPIPSSIKTSMSSSIPISSSIGTSASNTSPPSPSATSGTEPFLCEPYIGGRDDKQCQCQKQNCSDDCELITMFKGEDGCDDECQGCKPPEGF
ncbi:hypothetical protein BU24DRAFT_476571 [Aaosphaeria arxii CBS 175.79]|uniref:Lysine-specific metallo-endopeptidase domain-containing protein n=1 Tax=Aaosphaeria arxii CBS 175.79 TaxID=1450172 RepID=A0A6A5Y1R4_9PLEO|nr:uncharacterized protein BU24DRAFT_476571 [Aaosphaeria arxii CBS 175.79]KAF2019505.1 hypothetical protein BU24DRAFT_476571 [Aaosphaeria arxii CBS 175.79]